MNVSVNALTCEWCLLYGFDHAMTNKASLLASYLFGCQFTLPLGENGKALPLDRFHGSI